LVVLLVNSSLANIAEIAAISAVDGLDLQGAGRAFTNPTGSAAFSGCPIA